MNFSVRNMEESLVSDDHVSEGVIVKLDNGDILHIFRFDPGFQGDHVGDNAYIVKRRYSNGVWGELETVYNSHQYDDRNIHGGITKNGRIVIFFRYYDASINKGLDNFFIYSDDEGETWSDLNPIYETAGRSMVYGTGQMFYNPEIQKYCVVGYAKWYVEMRFSDDGSNWDEWVQVATGGGQYTLTECAGAYCNNGRMVVLIRDEERDIGHGLLQVTSDDNGETWSGISKTNIPPNDFWGCAPQLLYDDYFDILIAMNSDRRSYHSGSAAEESLYIYSASPEDVFASAEKWKLETSFSRPKTNSRHNFYGYPTYTKITQNKYFIVFTERDRDAKGEDTDFYQFELVINEERDDIQSKTGVYEAIPFKLINNGLVELEFFQKTTSGLKKLNVIVSQ